MGRLTIFAVRSAGARTDKPVSGNPRNVFPSIFDRRKPFSNNIFAEIFKPPIHTLPANFTHNRFSYVVVCVCVCARVYIYFVD